MQRAETAAQLLDNPVLREAFDAVEQDIVAQLHKAKLDDTSGHTRLVMALQITQAVQRQLWLVIQDGANADDQISLRGSRID